MPLPSFWTTVDFEECLSDAPLHVGKIQRTDYLKIGQYPIIDQSQEFISGYTNEEDLVYQGDLPIILFGDHTLVFKYINFPFVCGADGVKVLVPNKSIIDPEYYYFFLTNLNLQSRGYSRHYKQLRKNKITIPPLPEQRRIADILQHTDMLQQNRLSTIQKMEYLETALFHSFFGDPIANSLNWEMSKLSEVVAEDCPITYGIVQPGDEFENGALLVRPVDLGKRYLEKNKLKRIDPRISKRYTRTELEGDELLLSVRGQIGEISYADIELRGANVTRGIVPLRFSKRVFREYMYGFFKYSAVKEWQIRKAKGMAIKQLNLEDLRLLPVPIPDLKVQKKYANAIKELLGIESQIIQSNESLQDLFASLRFGAFTGNLTAPWREGRKDDLQRAAVERDKMLGLRGEKPRLIDYKTGRVTPEEMEGIRKALGNFAVYLASLQSHSEMLSSTGQKLEEINKSLSSSLLGISRDLITPFLESFRQSIQNIQLTLPVPPDEDEVNRQIDLLPLPQEKRAIHDVLDATTLRVLKLAHASPAYFTPEDLMLGAITSTQASASLRVLDSLGFVRLVEIDGVLRYHVIDANTDTALKPDQLQQ